MIERPILFSRLMVRAILDGRKTQTRRVIKPQPANPRYVGGVFANGSVGFIREDGRSVVCPYGKPGDRLWVRETHGIQLTPGESPDYPNGYVIYKADYQDDATFDPGGWRPSIHMPRWASRITLEIVKVGVERLQDISLEDVKAEGVHPFTFARGATSEKPANPRWKFIEQWDSLNAERGFGWNINPWVWLITFKRITANEEPS